MNAFDGRAPRRAGGAFSGRPGGKQDRHGLAVVGGRYVTSKSDRGSLVDTLLVLVPPVVPLAQATLVCLLQATDDNLQAVDFGELGGQLALVRLLGRLDLLDQLDDLGGLAGAEGALGLAVLRLPLRCRLVGGGLAAGLGARRDGIRLPARAPANCGVAGSGSGRGQLRDAVAGREATQAGRGHNGPAARQAPRGRRRRQRRRDGRGRGGRRGGRREAAGTAAGIAGGVIAGGGEAAVVGHAEVVAAGERIDGGAVIRCEFCLSDGGLISRQLSEPAPKSVRNGPKRLGSCRNTKHVNTSGT